MCCKPRDIQRAHDASEFFSCCCTPHIFFRRFISSKEKQQRLEEYKADLEREIAGLEERIEELKKEGK
jgi:hypothetical protein